MMRTLFWLVLHTFRNRMARRLERVRQPRYAIAMVAGLGYFWLVLLRPGRPSLLANASAGGGAHVTYALLIALLVASWWLLGGEKLALNFSPAEVQLLFPAPLTRRQLVQLKLLQMQVLIVFSALLWLLILGPSRGSAWLRGIALWVLFSTLYLHRVAASLVRASAAEHGAAGTRRNLSALIIFGGAALAVGWSIVHALPSLRAAAATGGTLSALGIVLHDPIVSAVLLPFRLVLAPVFAHSAAEWVRAIGPALILLGLHYPWVLRTDAAFEEAAATAASKRAEQIAISKSRTLRVRSVRGGVLRLPLPLSPTGRPAVAILWKNAIALARTIPIGTLIVLAITIVVVVVLTFMAASDAWSAANVIGFACLIIAGLSVVAGPLWVRNDLRFDLLRLELLRSFPLRGASLVRAEIAASVAALTTLQLALALIASFMLPATELTGFTPLDRVALFLSAVILLPSVNAAGLALQNAAALIFPAWMRLGLSRPGGIEAMGQSIVTALGSLLVLVLVLAVPAFLGVALAVVALSSIGLWAIPPAAGLAAAAVLAELWGITAWLGRVFERTEPTEVEPAT
jgi:hypothetical protein